MELDVMEMYENYVRQYNEAKKQRSHSLKPMIKFEAFESSVKARAHIPNFNFASYPRMVVEGQMLATYNQINSLLTNLERVNYRGFEDLLREKERKLGLPTESVTYLTVKDLEMRDDIYTLIGQFVKRYSREGSGFISITEDEGIEGSEV